MKLTKIRMEFDNGLVQELEGEKAAEWQKGVNGVLGLHQIRGYEYSSPKWNTIIEADEPEPNCETPLPTVLLDKHLIDAETTITITPADGSDLSYGITTADTTQRQINGYEST